SLRGLTGILSGLISVYAAWALAQKAFTEAANREMTLVGFETLLKSADRAKQMMKDLQELNKATPFEFGPLAESAKMMLALGTAADKVIPRMRVLSDAASLLGGEEALKRMVLALGQVEQKGKVSAEEMKQLTEVGVN